MRIREIIRRQIQRSGDGLNLAARVNAAIAANVDDDDAVVVVSSSSSDGIVQDSRRTARS